MKPANDSVVLSSESFDDALSTGPRAGRHTWGHLRAGGLITTAAWGLAMAAAATVLTIGWFSVVTPRSSPDLSMTIAARPAASPTASPPASPPPVRAAARAEAPSPELAAGLDALRTQMLAAQAAGPTFAARVDVAAAEKPDVKGPSAVPVATPTVVAQPPAAPTAETVASRPVLTADEIRAMRDRAAGLIAVGDIAAARRLAEYVAASGDGGALFMLAETFDPKQLARWHVRGVRGDSARARDLYDQALQRGVAEARARIAALP